MKSIQEIIENHILGEIFSEFPTNLNNAFQFFLEADVDQTTFVGDSSLGEEWGYSVCEAYGLDNIRTIRGLMQSMYNDLERLKSSLFQQATSCVKIYKEEIETTNAFYETAQLPNAILKEQGTDDEHIVFITVSEESVS